MLDIGCQSRQRRAAGIYTRRIHLGRCLKRGDGLGNTQWRHVLVGGGPLLRFALAGDAVVLHAAQANQRFRDVMRVALVAGML